MLILRRSLGESIILSCPDWSSDIRILIAERDPINGRIKLGFEAPPEITILREELVRRDAEKTEIGGKTDVLSP
jgi:carbon storage regulator CsrA